MSSALAFALGFGLGAVLMLLCLMILARHWGYR